MAFNIVRNGKKITLSLEKMEKAAKAFEEETKPKDGDLILVVDKSDKGDIIEFGIFDADELEEDGQLGTKNGYCLGYINGKTKNGNTHSRVATVIKDKKIIDLIVPLIEKYCHKE